MREGKEAGGGYWGGSWEEAEEAYRAIGRAPRRQGAAAGGYRGSGDDGGVGCCFAAPSATPAGVSLSSRASPAERGP